MKNNTNYMRSVNDYSLSAHEIYNEETGNRFPIDTRVFTAKNVTTANFEQAQALVLKEFTQNGFVLNREYSINYDDGNGPGEESQYTIYEQFFFVLIKDNNVPKTPEFLKIDDVVVLEMYRRNNELVILTLSNISTRSILQPAISYMAANFRPPVKERVYYTIGANAKGFSLVEMNISTTYDADLINWNYNDSFIPVHDTIIDYIDNNKKGLILLHGVPGSGKTSYIEQLVCKGGTRKVVYIPPHLANSIASPQFVEFVNEELKGCVLVIEDAEAVLIERGGVGSDNNAVANILNLSDGILGKALNVLIIATFNTETRFIDQALLRKGRLVTQYFFGPLDSVKATQLLEKLHGEGTRLKHGEELTLANIYNKDVVQHIEAPKQKGSFGFT
ncbi:ATPase [Xanthomonas phage Xoo-sp13]|nr:ATPase [Xanthomonas phage Xoo-sp13]